MQNKIYFSLMITFILICFSGMSLADVERQLTADQMIDVGLSYGVNSEYPTIITSDSGFQFGIASDDFDALINLSNYDELTFYKAGFYQADTLVTSNATYYASGNVKGAFTLRIGQSESKITQIYDTFLGYKAQNKDVFLVYDGQWYIALGSYISESAAKKDLDSVALKYSGIDIATMKLSQYQMLVYGNDMPLLSYNTALDDFIFKTDFFKWDDHTYRNSVMFKRLTTSDYSVINHLTMSEYLYGVVPKEMSKTWPIEALKAQAVAARNYALKCLGEHAEDGFDVCTTTDCQVYGGVDAEGSLSNEAVDATVGEVLLYDDELVTCYYHANSGGHTEDIENVWSGSLPYLKGVDDPYSLGKSNATWTVTLSENEIVNELAASGYDIGTYQGVTIDERSDNGHVMSITFKGTKGNAVLLKESMRSVFGYSIVKSMQFTFEEASVQTLVIKDADSTVSSQSSSLYVISANGLQSIDNNVYAMSEGGLTYLENDPGISESDKGALTLYGKGYGHGLGMSQWGAYGMAEAGFDYEAILKFYYSGTRLVELD